MFKARFVGILYASSYGTRPGLEPWVRATLRRQNLRSTYMFRIIRVAVAKATEGGRVFCEFD